MNSNVHILWGGALFGKKGNPRISWSAVAGAIAPDLVMYILIAMALISGQTFTQIFSVSYFTPAWHIPINLTNSIWLYGPVLLWGFWKRQPATIAFSASAFLHLITDFFLHREDGHAYFYPLSDYIFISPLSYWEQAYFALEVSAVILVLSFVLFALVMVKHKNLWARLGYGVLLALEVVFFASFVIFDPF